MINFSCAGRAFFVVLEITFSNTRRPSALDSSYLRLKECGSGLLKTQIPKQNTKSPEPLRGFSVSRRAVSRDTEVDTMSALNNLNSLTKILFIVLLILIFYQLPVQQTLLWYQFLYMDNYHKNEMCF